MPRKRGSQWDSARDAMLDMSEKSRTVDERENVPDKACGKCKNFYQISGNGICNVLKDGTDFTIDPPKFVTEGEVFLPTMFNMDAAKCTYYNEMELIDTDISQSSDPMYSRHQRQMQK